MQNFRRPLWEFHVTTSRASYILESDDLTVVAVTEWHFLPSIRLTILWPISGKVTNIHTAYSITTALTEGIDLGTCSTLPNMSSEQLDQ